MHHGIMKNQQNQKNPLSNVIRHSGKKQPECYRIEVAGVLDPDWSERLGGMRIETRVGEISGESVTLLEGLVTDQAQLSGILNTLSNLRYKLLSVKMLEE